MEGLIILAVVWFAISAFGKANKQAKEQAKKQARSIPRGAGAPAPAAPAWPEEGESRNDETGCVGGSLAHEIHEGEMASGSLNYQPPVEYEAHIRPPVGEPEPAVARERARVSPGQMRSAVVMAEVLNRPVSMRGSRTGGRVVR